MGMWFGGRAGGDKLLPPMMSQNGGYSLGDKAGSGGEPEVFNPTAPSCVADEIEAPGMRVIH